MGSNWPITSLDSHISIKHGFAFKGEFFKDSPTPDCLLTPGNFAIGGGFKGDKYKYYDGPVPSDYVLKAGDLVVTMTDLSKQADTLGYSALIPAQQNKCFLHNQRTGLVQFKDDELDKVFLYFLLRSKEYRHHVVSGATGTTVKHTSPTKILSYKFRKPPKPLQVAIGLNLLSIEKKININHQINQTLEQMAQALFKSWFVDFDPVIDNALDAGFFEQNSALPEELLRRAEQRKIVREQSDFKPLPAETRQLFPAAFEECEEPSLGLGGWMPKGWGNGVLSDLLILQRGFDLPKSKRTDGSIPLMAASGQDGTHNESKVRGPGVVTGRSGKLGVVNLVIEDFWPLNTTLWIKEYPRSNPYHAYFLLQTIPLEQFNSGSAVPTLNRNHVHNKPVTLPSQDLLNKYADLVKDNFTQIQNRSIQSKTLEKLRDTLLPKLISGELRLNDDGTLASGNTDC